MKKSLSKLPDYAKADLKQIVTLIREFVSQLQNDDHPVRNSDKRIFMDLTNGTSSASRHPL